MKKIIIILAIIFISTISYAAETEKRISLPESTVNKLFNYLITKQYKDVSALIQEIQMKVKVIENKDVISNKKKNKK